MIFSKELYEDIRGNYIDFENITQDEYITQYNEENETIEYLNKHTLFVADYICIYKLAHKSKEWAWNEHGMCIGSWKNYDMFYCDIRRDNIHGYRQTETNADTEPEAIFKACEYIFKELLNAKD